jgi:hypothetical protein
VEAVPANLVKNVRTPPVLNRWSFEPAAGLGNYCKMVRLLVHVCIVVEASHVEEAVLKARLFDCFYKNY